MPVVCGRKHCAKCLRWRPVVDFQCRRRTRNGEAVLTTRCTTCLRIDVRESKLNPRIRERRREYQRIWTAARRRQAGVPERKWGKRSKRGSLTSGHFSEQLPAEPLLKWLAAEARRRDMTKTELVVVGGLDDKQHDRWTERGYVTMGMADAFLLRLTGSAAAFDLLYPLEGET